MRTRGRFLVFVVLLGLAGACELLDTPLELATDGPSGVSVKPQDSASPDAVVGEGAVIGERPHAVVGIDLAVSGSFHPGALLEVEGRVSVNVPIRDLNLRIWAPELEFARASGFGEGYRIQEGLIIPNLREMDVPGELASGERQIAASFSIPAPGLYQVIVSARATPLIRDFRVNSVAHKVVWLLIDDEGGGVLPEFSPDAVPEGYLEEPGPFRREALRPYRALSPSGPSRTLGSDQVKGYVYYIDNDTQEPVAVEGTRIKLHEMNHLGDTIGVQLAETDSDGIATFTCSGDLEDMEGLLWDPDIRVSTYSHSKGVQCDDPAPTYLFYVGPSGEIFMNLEHEIIPGVESAFSDSRSQIEVKYYSSSGTSEYKSSDYIKIFSNDVWGDDGIRVQAHEYGHAFHEKALGGNSVLGDCNGQHTYSLLTNYGCAFSEGFADFVAMTLGYGPFSDSHRYARPCVEYDFSLPTPHCETWGSYGVGLLKTEGQVMHFLNDITDASNNDFDSGVYYDQVTISRAQLADIYETCQVNTGSWIRPGRIHWLIHCIQRAIDGYWDSFPTSEEPSAYTVTASHSPDFDDVRQLWRTQFFNKLTLHDPLTVNITGSESVPPETECAWQAWPAGGLGPFDYAWSGALSGSGFTVEGELSYSGWLYVSVTDSLSNQASDSFYITVDEAAECNW